MDETTISSIATVFSNHRVESERHIKSEILLLDVHHGVVSSWCGVKQFIVAAHRQGTRRRRVRSEAVFVSATARSAGPTDWAGE